MIWAMVIIQEAMTSVNILPVPAIPFPSPACEASKNSVF